MKYKNDRCNNWQPRRTAKSILNESKFYYNLNKKYNWFSINIDVSEVDVRIIRREFKKTFGDDMKYVLKIIETDVVNKKQLFLNCILENDKNYILEILRETITDFDYKMRMLKLEDIIKEN